MFNVDKTEFLKLNSSLFVFGIIAGFLIFLILCLVTPHASKFKQTVLNTLAGLQEITLWIILPAIIGSTLGGLTLIFFGAEDGYTLIKMGLVLVYSISVWVISIMVSMAVLLAGWLVYVKFQKANLNSMSHNMKSPADQDWKEWLENQ